SCSWCWRSISSGTGCATRWTRSCVNCSAMAEPVLDVRNLTTHIVTRWGTIKAVDSVSFTVGEGETLGIVGESGSGKSMTCLSLLRLVPKPAARILGGEIRLDGDELLKKTEREMQKIRG